MTNEQTKQDAQHFMYKNIGWLALGLLVLAAIATITLVRGWSFSSPIQNTISVTADGEVRTTKDMALFTFSHIAEAKTAAEARKQLAEKINPALAALRKLGVDDNQLTTETTSVNPQYEAPQPCTPAGCPPFNPNPKIVGWQASQTVSVRVKNVEKVDPGQVLRVITDAGVTNVTGPNFDIDADRESELRVEARKLAIEKAQAKAEVLAKQLGVKLVRVVSFSEGNDNMYFPQYNMKASFMEVGDAMGGVPELPMGEGKVRSNVTIVYEIR